MIKTQTAYAAKGVVADMVSRMKFINIIGPSKEFTRIVSQYVMEREIELENPMTALRNVGGFVPNTEGNPAEEIMKRFIEVFEYARIDYSGIERHNAHFTKEELVRIVESFDTKIHALKGRIEELSAETEHYRRIADTLLPVVKSAVHLEQLGRLKYIRYRFGKMPIASYRRLDTYLRDLPAYFMPMTTDDEFVWGINFVSEANEESVDRAFATLYFEKYAIGDDDEGTPAQIIEKLEKRCIAHSEEIERLKRQIASTIAIQKDDLIKAFADIKYDYDLYNIRRFTSNSQNSFCLTGWAAEDEAERLVAEAETDSECMVLVDTPDTVSHITPPTRLKNLRIFKPFEEFVRMYGVPGYNELDPTPFLAVVYTLLFGIMFGDAGHGLCLVLAGVLMLIFKKGGFLARLLVPIGISSTVFGFVYGSFFGLEGERAVIKPLWFTPFESSETMMNTLIYAVALGVVLIIICMVFNIINGVRQRNLQKILFSQNGVAGLVFYTAVICYIAGVISGNGNPTAAAVCIAVSLLLIFLQEPLGKMSARRRQRLPKGFFTEAFFETFEILLSFVTNTVSFLRVGAFALSHAGMMSVVVAFMYRLDFAGSVAVAIFGNALVIGLEGLIVGIQVLRLGFYEMFSRFYSGNGREFKSIRNS